MSKRLLPEKKTARTEFIDMTSTKKYQWVDREGSLIYSTGTAEVQNPCVNMFILYLSNKYKH